MAQDRGHVACIFRRGATSIRSHSAIWIECLVKKACTAEAAQTQCGTEVFAAYHGRGKITLAT